MGRVEERLDSRHAGTPSRLRRSRRMVDASRPAAVLAGRIVSALVLASVLTVLVALADRLVAHWSDSHLMLAVLVLWCTLFAGLLVFCDGVRNFAHGVVADLGGLKAPEVSGPGRLDVPVYDPGIPDEPALEKTPGRSQVFLHPLGGPGQAGAGGALKKTPGRSQVFLHPLGGPGQAGAGGALKKTPGRSQVFLHPLGGPGEARAGGSLKKTPGRSQVFLHPLGGPGEARAGGADRQQDFFQRTAPPFILPR